MGFFSRRKKRRNTSTYNSQQMHQDHLSSVALWTATQPGYVAPSEDEQEREAEASVDEKVVSETEDTKPAETDTRDSGVFESSTDTSSSPGVFESSSSSDSYSSSYDSPSPSSSSYDYGSSSSYDSGSSYSGGGDSGGSW